MEPSKVSILGIGLMGRELAIHLLKGGWKVIAWNRSPSKTEELKEAGGDLTIATSSKEAIKSSSVVISVLFSAPIFNEVLDSLDAEDYKGRTFISVSTISPDDSISLYKRVTAHGGEYIEAPVLGNPLVARKAGLQIMIGATKEQFEKISKMISLWGIPRYVGEVGAAARVKLSLNNILGSTLAAFTSSCAYLASTGVDTDIFETILSNGTFAMNFPYFNVWHRKIKNKKYDEVGFSLAGIHKDVKLLLEQSKLTGIDTTHTEGTFQIYDRAVKNLDANKDFSIVYEHIIKKDNK